ncbi:hypothetical protein [Saccharicrinis aurantiacus]|uniref:hypothetical protein n=1 Tax=Saccharicrinis aurantiacus TaxID=1849719 RepID=UPI0024913684|nr:hypothetical protein [Saccharicrinis aurantiacus]
MVFKKNEGQNFEKDCLEVFENLLQAYKKAAESTVWESNMDILIEKLTHFPTAPFPVELMSLFDYNYLVQSEDIDSVIDKALIIRERMEHTQRYVTINEKYFSSFLFPANTHLKRLEVYNNEGELCYLQKGTIRIKAKQLFRWIIPSSSPVKFQDIISIRQKTTHYKNLEIYYYSPIVDLSSTNPQDYYNFFCDYFGKVQFLKYFRSKEEVEVVPKLTESVPNAYETILRFSKAQQVLWVYFIFRLLGLKLRVDIGNSTLACFLCMVNGIDMKTYKNSYFYRLIEKAPYIKKDKNLLVDLEVIRLHFEERNFPTAEIEKLIVEIVTR